MQVGAYDNPDDSTGVRMSATTEVELLVLSDFRRVVILFDRPLSVFTPEKEAAIVA